MVSWKDHCNQLNEGKQNKTKQNTSGLLDMVLHNILVPLKEEKEMTEDEIAGWHHRLNGHEFEHALGDGDG